MRLGHFEQLIPEPYHDVVIPREAARGMEVVIQVLYTAQAAKSVRCRLFFMYFIPIFCLFLQKSACFLGNNQLLMPFQAQTALLKRFA